jgi:chemotaxis protein CheD
MNTITVGVGDLQVSRDPDSVIVTYGLGSCIAVLAHDPIRKIAGMVHYMLPLASLTPEKSKERPAMFGDTGVPLLFKKLAEMSANKSDLIVKVIGGASIQDSNGTFEIGKRNYVILRKLLWSAGVAIRAESVGGSVARTARLFVGDGRVTVRASDTFKEMDL